MLRYHILIFHCMEDKLPNNTVFSIAHRLFCGKTRPNLNNYIPTLPAVVFCSA